MFNQFLINPKIYNDDSQTLRIDRGESLQTYDSIAWLFPEFECPARLQKHPAIIMDFHHLPHVE